MAQETLHSPGAGRSSLHRAPEQLLRGKALRCLKSFGDNSHGQRAGLRTHKQKTWENDGFSERDLKIWHILDIFIHIWQHWFPSCFIPWTGGNQRLMAEALKPRLLRTYRGRGVFGEAKMSCTAAGAPGAWRIISVAGDPLVICCSSLLNMAIDTLIVRWFAHLRWWFSVVLPFSSLICPF